jgi:hypothetical protein
MAGAAVLASEEERMCRAWCEKTATHKNRAIAKVTTMVADTDSLKAAPPGGTWPHDLGDTFLIVFSAPNL